MLTDRNIKNLKLYCKGDYTKIEGYARAMADKSNTTYCCHHRLETHFEDGTPRPKPLKAELLEELGYYEQRPASELIILTLREHRQLHKKAEGCNTYDTDEEAKKAQLEQIQQWNKNHPDKVKEATRKWREDNSDKAKEYNRKWREENPEYARKYKKENPEKTKRASKVCNWRRSHPGSTDFPKKWTQEDIEYFYKLHK